MCAILNYVYVWFILSMIYSMRNRNPNLYKVITYIANHHPHCPILWQWIHPPLTSYFLSHFFYSLVGSSLIFYLLEFSIQNNMKIITYCNVLNDCCNWVREWQVIKGSSKDRRKHFTSFLTLLVISWHHCNKHVIHFCILHHVSQCFMEDAL